MLSFQKGSYKILKGSPKANVWLLETASFWNTELSKQKGWMSHIQDQQTNVFSGCCEVLVLKASCLHICVPPVHFHVSYIIYYIPPQWAVVWIWILHQQIVINSRLTFHGNSSRQLRWRCEELVRTKASDCPSPLLCSTVSYSRSDRKTVSNLQCIHSSIGNRSLL